MSVTTDPAKADLFYVPIFSSCYRLVTLARQGCEFQMDCVCAFMLLRAKSTPCKNSGIGGEVCDVVIRVVVVVEVVVVVVVVGSNVLCVLCDVDRSSGRSL